jgi:hypothetical protein
MLETRKRSTIVLAESDLQCCWCNGVREPHDASYFRPAVKQGDVDACMSISAGDVPFHAIEVGLRAVISVEVFHPSLLPGIYNLP